MSGKPQAEDLVRRHLVVDESELLEELIQKAKGFVALDDKGGVHVRGPRSKFTTSQLVQLFLIGRYLAHLGKLAPKDTATTAEVAEFAGTGSDVASARLGELRSEGNVESVARGEWRIVKVRIIDVLASFEDTSAEVGKR